MIRRWSTMLWTLRKRLKLTWSLMKDDRVPLWQKAIPLLPLLYIVSPLNLLTFAIPIIGQIDDVLLIVMSMELLERVVDKRVLSEYRKK